MAERKLISVNELAKLIPVAKVTLYRWAREKTIPSVKRGRKVLIPESLIDELIATAKNGGGER